MTCAASSTLCHPEAPKNEGVILGAWMTLSRGATFDLRARKARRWIAFSATRWQRNRGSAAHLFPSVRAGRAVSEKPIHPRILIFNLLHKTSLAAERGSMGAVEGPPRRRRPGQAEADSFAGEQASSGFSCGAANGLNNVMRTNYNLDATTGRRCGLRRDGWIVRFWGVRTPGGRSFLARPRG